MAIALGMLVGLMLGLTGAGGSVVAVPLLIFALDLTLQQAAPVALLAACIAAGIGTLVGWDVRTVRYRAALLMAGAATATTWIGVRAADHLSNDSLLLGFSVVLAVIATRMLLQLRRPQTPTPAKTLCSLDPVTGRLIWTPRAIALFGAVGALNGVLTGLLGVGGGFLIVPVLRMITPMSMHAAVATSLMTVSLTTAAAVGAHIAHDAAMPWMLALPFVAGAVLGMGGGRLLAPHLSGPVLQAAFAITLLVCAASLTNSALT